jgi:hypothetical protein
MVTAVAVVERKRKRMNNSTQLEQNKFMDLSVIYLN